jgi:hypothetical protein
MAATRFHTMEVQLMSDTTEQTDVSLVIADRDQNYYLIPVEVFERGRVPAEQKAEVEEAMREYEVSGYLLQFAAGMVLGGALVAGGVVVGAGIGMAGAAVGYTIAQSR